MASNSSPWLHQLSLKRPPQILDKDFDGDIVIVGAGIAGISTAFFCLKYTNRPVTIIEASRVAHGATGHNAGQIVSYFEHPFSHLVEQYGLTLAAKAQEAIFYAWDLIDEMYWEGRLTAPLAKFTGYAGCSTITQIIDHLRNIKYQREAGLDIEGMLVVNRPDIIAAIPSEYSELYARVDHDYILTLLETKDERYIAALASRKGCVNSALLCEEMVESLLEQYPDRFRLFEHSPVKEVVLKDGIAQLSVNNHAITAQRVVLCTNGFEHFKLTNTVGEDIDPAFHQLVIGKIGYMAAYFEDDQRKPKAISYFPSGETAGRETSRAQRRVDEEDPYFYLTRRRFHHNTLGDGNLVCIGGPEDNVDRKQDYLTADVNFPERASEEISAFLKTAFAPSPEKLDYLFTWHGLMGYTPHGLRVIGPEPCNPVLLYNLGCNGVGILSSIYGGKRIADFMVHGVLDRSIFDPIDQREHKKQSGP